MSSLKLRERERGADRETDRDLPEKQGCHCLEFAESKMKEFHQVAIERHGSSCFINMKEKTISLKSSTEIFLTEISKCYAMTTL